MTATQTIKAINNCKTVKEVNAFLTAEKSSDKPRKTVITACKERIADLTPAPEATEEEKGTGTIPASDANTAGNAPSETPTAETPAPRAPHTGKPQPVVAPTPAPAPVENAKATAKSKESERIASFHSKITWITCAEITRFATEFFGDDMKTISTKDYVVTITLKSGTKIEKRGK